LSKLTAGLRSVPIAPWKLPVVGHAVGLWHDPLLFVRSLPRLGEIVRVDLGSWPVYFLTTPRLVHEILVTQGRHVDKGRSFAKLRPLFGNGLMTAEGDFHRQQRRIIQPLFLRDHVSGYVDTMRKHAAATADSWQSGQQVAVDQAMYELTLTTVVDIMFSADVTPQAVSVVQRALPAIASGTIRRAFTPQVVDRLPLPFNREYNAAADGLHRVLDQLIHAGHGAAAGRQDLLTLLLSTGMSDQQVRDELVTILITGTETTATTLSWAFHELAGHPGIEQRLCAELGAVLSGRAITAGDVPDLPYTNQFLNEVTRLHAMLVSMRRATAPLSLGGYDFPAGTEFAYSPYMLHHDPRRYRDPEVLEPQRWLPAGLKRLGGEEFIPFGDGNRKCLGEHFAWNMLVVSLATILTRWRLRPAPGHDVREVPAAVPKPDRLPMTPLPAIHYSAHQTTP
jgi:cytochrome P450